jgi:hypothetical protein
MWKLVVFAVRSAGKLFRLNGIAGLLIEQSKRILKLS